MSDKVQITIKNKVGEKYADLQTKIVTPSKETQVITADEGYYGLREVIVGAQVVDTESITEDVNSIKVMLTDGANATPKDIVLGKTAYVKGEKITGSLEISGTLDISEDGEYDVRSYANVNVQTGSKLKKLLDYTKSCRNMFYENKEITDLTGYIAYEDTSNVTNMERMFSNSTIKTIPQLDTSNVTNMTHMFSDTSITTIPQLDTSNVTNMANMFYYCNSLTTIPQLDISKATSVVGAFDYCKKLTNLTLLNIKRNLQVGSGSTWGHLLTLESLLGLCQECVNVNSSRTLTVGSSNMNKLANVYVKLTNQPEEDETLPKIPMVQCESTDEGAMTINEYMALKKWTLQ